MTDVWNYIICFGWAWISSKLPIADLKACRSGWRLFIWCCCLVSAFVTALLCCCFSFWLLNIYTLLFLHLDRTCLTDCLGFLLAKSTFCVQKSTSNMAWNGGQMFLREAVCEGVSLCASSLRFWPFDLLLLTSSKCVDVGSRLKPIYWFGDVEPTTLIKHQPLHIPWYEGGEDVIFTPEPLEWLSIRPALTFLNTRVNHLKFI